MSTFSHLQSVFIETPLVARHRAAQEGPLGTRRTQTLPVNSAWFSHLADRPHPDTWKWPTGPSQHSCTKMLYFIYGAKPGNWILGSCSQQDVSTRRMLRAGSGLTGADPDRTSALPAYGPRSGQLVTDRRVTAVWCHTPDTGSRHRNQSLQRTVEGKPENLSLWFATEGPAWTIQEPTFEICQCRQCVKKILEEKRKPLQIICIRRKKLSCSMNIEGEGLTHGDSVCFNHFTQPSKDSLKTVCSTCFIQGSALYVPDLLVSMYITILRRAEGK